MEIKFETIADVREIAVVYARGECRVGTLAESATRYAVAPASEGARSDRASLLRELAAAVPQPARDVLTAVALSLAISRL